MSAPAAKDQQPQAEVGNEAQFEEKVKDITADLAKAHLAHLETSLENISPEHKAALKGMKDILGNQAADPDNILIKYLIAAYFDSAKGAQSYLDYRKWRTEYKVEALLQGAPPFDDLARKLIPHGYIGNDKEGRPVYYEKTGKIRVNELLQLLSAEDFIKSHVYGMESLMRKMEESSKKRGKTIDCLTTVLDLNGLSLNHSFAFPLLQKVTEFDYKTYPERVGLILVINAPWIAPTLWEGIKRFIDESTKSKLVVLSGNYKEELLKYIDADNLPQEYGGNAPNIPEATEEELKKFTHVDKSGLALTDQYVAAGYNHTVELKGKKDDEFQWSFEVQGGYDIEFSVKMQEDGKDKSAAIKVPSRCTTNKGSYVATGDCTVTFLWDNAYSYFNGKNIKLHASVVPKK